MKILVCAVLIPLTALLVSCSTAGHESVLSGHDSTALDKPVSLAQPYPKSYSDAPTDKISLQYAVLQMARQVGLKYDFEGSKLNCGDVLKKWITPNIKDVPFREALRQILEPQGLTYELRGKELTVTRKP